MRLPLILALVLAATPTLAQPAQQGAPADAMASFDKELDALFATTGLTADQAATRAVKASPTVQARTAAIDIAIAQAEMAELVRVPRVGVSATYTRLSPIDSLLLTPDPNGPKFSFSENSYATQASLGVALSDYVLRYPKLI
nr:hypothetical protein [Myxococcota bacterium]